MGRGLKSKGEVIDLALVGRRDSRNFGYGRQMSYTGQQALKGMFDDGHYGTVKAHSDRRHTSPSLVVPHKGPQ